MSIKWLLGGNIIYAITQWLILVLLTRFFSTSELGFYFFALSLVAPLALLLSLKLPNLVVTLEESLINEKNVFFARNLLSAFLIFICFMFYILFFQKNTDFLTLSAVIIYKILEGNDDITVSFFQKKLKFKEIFLIKSIRSGVYLSFVFVCCLLFDRIDYALIFATIGYFIFWLIRNKKYLVRSNIYEEKKFILNFFRNGLPLSISASISSLNVSGVRLYIGYVMGSTSLAIYGVISYSLVVFSIVISALGQYFLPFFVSSKSDAGLFKKTIYKSQYIVITIGLLCVVISWAIGDLLLNFFYGNEYSEYGKYLCLIFIANIFKSSSALIGTAMTSLRIYNFQLKFTFFSLFLTVLFLPVFISYFNMLGAFLGLILVSFIEWILYFTFARQRFLEKM